MNKEEQKNKNSIESRKFEISEKVNRWKGIIESDKDYKDLMKEIFEKKYK